MSTWEFNDKGQAFVSFAEFDNYMIDTDVSVRITVFMLLLMMLE